MTSAVYIPICSQWSLVYLCSFTFSCLQASEWVLPSPPPLLASSLTTWTRCCRPSDTAVNDFDVVAAWKVADSLGDVSGGFSDVKLDEAETWSLLFSEVLEEWESLQRSSLSLVRLGLEMPGLCTITKMGIWLAHFDIEVGCRKQPPHIRVSPIAWREGAMKWRLKEESMGQNYNYLKDF